MPRILPTLLLFLALVGAFSCASTGLPPRWNPEQSRISEEVFENFRLNVSDYPALNDLASEAYTALLAQDWGLAINKLAQAHVALAASSPQSARQSFFTEVLGKMFLELPALGPEIVRALEPLGLVSSDMHVLDSLLENQPFTLVWPQEPVVLLALEPEARGMMSPFIDLGMFPLVEVIIEGRSYRMMLDTGFSVSTFFRDRVEALSLNTLEGLDLNMTASDGRPVAARMAQVPRMDLGTLEIRNAVVGLVDRPWNFPLDVDGFLGFDILGQLVWEWDSRAGQIRLYPDYEEDGRPANFFWLGLPIVHTLAGDDRQKLLFFVDSGANHSWFKPEARQALGATTLRQSRAWAFGLAGDSRPQGHWLQFSGFYLDGHELLYDNYRSSYIDSFRNFGAGVLGADLAAAGILRFNFPRGRLRFFPYGFSEQ